MTSRIRDLSNLGISKYIELDKLQPFEALEFLIDRTKSISRGSHEIEGAINLAEELDFLPLALEQAGSYIYHNKMSFHKYLEEYNLQGSKFLEKFGPQIGDYKYSVATTWIISFLKIETVSAAALDILFISAFLRPESIPFELISQGASKLGENLSNALKYQNDDTVNLNELLSHLVNYSLIKRDVDSQSYSIHRLLQKTIIDELEDRDSIFMGN